MNGVAIEELSVARKEAAKKLTSRLRWFSGAPLREGKDALAVNRIGVIISDAKGKVTYGSAFVTSRPVSSRKTTSISSPPAPGPDGRSRTRALTS